MCRLIAVADYKFYQTIASNNIYDAANYIVSIIGLELWCLTFNNNSVISWQLVLLVEETGENHQPVTSHKQTIT